MKRAKRFIVQPYEWFVYFYDDRQRWARATSRAQFGTYLTQLADTKDCKGICSCDADAKAAFIGVFDGSVGTLAHEMTHAAMEILTHAGVKVTGDNNEALAYLVSFMVEAGMPAMSEKRRRPQ